MNDKIKKIVDKCKKIKGFEIICALVIAAVAVCIYFSVNAMTGDAKTDKKQSASEQTGLIGEVQDILSKIDGVGECQVLITYKSSGEDKPVISNSTDNIQGVVVVAEGASDVLARIKITNALCTLLKIEANNIQIFEMK